MRRVTLFCLASFAFACGPELPADPEAPPPDVYRLDRNTGSTWKPNPNFVPDPVPAGGTVGFSKKRLRTEGEVIVVEGSVDTVSSMGAEWGISGDNQRAIVDEVLAEYPDHFDTISIFLTFIDQNHVGTAYYQGIANEVDGIGRMSFNGRSQWGLPSRGRLSGFINMNSLDMWGGRDGIGRAFSGYQAVLAQELSHRWLMFLQHNDESGRLSDAFLGRQDAHWSPLVHAYGSVQDGLDWRDNQDGTFTVLGRDYGFAPVDLYAMGIYGPAQVEDWYYLVEANLEGMPLDKTSRIPNGARVRGRRVNVGLDQVIAAMGPRNPPKGTETPYYRAAFVLVTTPGMAEADWQPYLRAVQEVQENFPRTWKEWTLRAGAICTRATQLCTEADLSLHSFSVKDGNDDLVAPGETFDLHLTIRNDGVGRDAEQVRVIVESLMPEVQVLTGTVTVPRIAEGATLEVPSPFQVRVAEGVTCGSTLQLRVRQISQEGPEFKDNLDMVIGNKTLRGDPLHEAPNWTVDPDGSDTAVAGFWELGAPDFISVLGIITQPKEDHSPGEGKLAFHTGPRKGDLFSTHDVDGGTTTLESPVFAIEGARDPSLVFYRWRVGRNFADRAGPAPMPEAALVVSASSDGGDHWVEIGRFSEDTPEWTRTTLRLRPHVEPSNRMRFRFSIADGSASGTVEAGIDDIEIIDVLETCKVAPIPSDGTDGGEGEGRGGGNMRGDDEGCSCASSRAPGDAHASLVAAAFGLALLVRRRRR